MATKEKGKKQKETLLVVRPAVRRWGLDYLHVSLAILVVILVVLAFALSTFRQGPVYINCLRGIVNGTCAQPIHNSSQALSSAESVLASYAPVNSSLSLLAYYSFPNQANASYIVNQSEWLVRIPYLSPFNGSRYEFDILLYDSNLSLVRPFLQTAEPAQFTKNRVVALGTVQIAGKVACSTKKPIPVYLIVDPYAPGAIASMYAGINASSKYNSSVNLTDKFVFTGYAVSKYAGFGINETQDVGAYLFCASQQPRFSAFLANYSLLYDGNPLSLLELNQVATGSGVNMTRLNACLQNSSAALNGQQKLTQFYNITTTPTFIVNCRYATIPQMLDNTVSYALNKTS